MQALFLHGPAACGKLTVARELAALAGFRLFHNHLTVDLALALFDFGSEGFVALRERIWLESFRQAARDDTSFVFTFHPEASVAGDLPQRLRSVVEAEGGRLEFVELTCPEEEIERRIEAESRAEFGKLRSLVDYRRLRDAGAFDFPPLPAPAVSVDTGSLAPAEAARLIYDRIVAGGSDASS